MIGSPAVRLAVSTIETWLESPATAASLPSGVTATALPLTGIGFPTAWSVAVSMTARPFVPAT